MAEYGVVLAVITAVSSRHWVCFRAPLAPRSTTSLASSKPK